LSLVGPYNRVYVLRLGHRPQRDKRVTTHAALVARAFGANGFVLASVCDDSVERSLNHVIRCWGGSVHYECGVNPKRYVEVWKEQGGEVIHLTMYGIPIQFAIDEIRSSPRDKLIIIGAEKVERYYYEQADYNVAVTSEPHSEIAALAVFLDRLYRGRELEYNLKGRGKRVIPQRKGKKVVGGVEC
jgi:tRNA (cytidine56-2'-O)-methyltransferase